MAIHNENKIIAHYRDGNLVKGTTLDFFPTRDRFRLTDERDESHEVHLEELKAVFFVKSFDGDLDYSEKKGFFSRQMQGKKVMVEFADGEVIFGYTLSYSAKGLGFFMFPGDPECNNTKVFVIHSAAKRVKLINLTTGHSQYTG